MKQSVQTIAELAEVFLRDAEANRNKPSVLATKRQILAKHILPILADVSAANIDVEHVAQIKYSLAGVSPKTANNVLCVLRCLLSCAEERGLLADPPRVKPLRSARPEVSCFTPDEITKLLKGAHALGWQHHVTMLLGARAGLRRGEMLGLRWSDIEFEAKRLTVRRAIWQGYISQPKSGRPRVIPIPAGLVAALLDAPRHSETVLNRGAGQEKAIAADVRKWFRAAKNEARIETPGTLHSLRHSYCTHLASAGVPLHVVQALAGHSTITTTQRYLHPLEADMIFAVDRMGW